MNRIIGYASATSVFPGESIHFHLSSPRSRLNPQRQFMIQVVPLTAAHPLNNQPLPAPLHAGGGQVTHHAVPATAPEDGCNWPRTYTLPIPAGWNSGMYVARFRTIDSALEFDIPFVVKANRRGPHARFLMASAVSTPQAYNFFGGRSLYGRMVGNAIQWGNGAATAVSFDRPYGTPNGIPWEVQMWELPFVRWLEQTGINCDFCTSIDLHSDAALLNRYCMLLSVGHDEYWSKEMRDNVEAFIRNGGNVAFFSGNTCWWQIRFEANNRRMVCYRQAQLDPLNGQDNSRVTVNWYQPPVARPENSLTGVSFRYGAFYGNAVPLVGYTVRAANHWVFTGTGLANGNVFGQTPVQDGDVYKNIVGYETDATPIDGNLNPTYADGTPRSFQILAIANLLNWTGQAGWATMGVYQEPGQGMVFTAATTNWASWLSQDPRVARITRNVLFRRCGRRPRVSAPLGPEFEIARP